MAVDVCSEISSAGISPRISFSHDLNQATDHYAVSIEDRPHQRLDSFLLDSDFDFCIGNSFVQELSSADELFSNGKILPIEVKKNLIIFNSTSNSNNQQNMAAKPHHHHHHHHHHQRTSTETATEKEKKQLKEFLSMSIDEDDQKPHPTFKSFWQFKRSNSLNCDSTRSKGLIRSLQFLSRSNSTGSAPNPPKKQSMMMMPKENHHKPQTLQRQASVSSTRKSSVTPSSGSFHSYNASQFQTQKPPMLKKCGSHGNGVRISPVLNIPPPYISRGTVSLFGLGSLFCNGKVKKKKR